MTFALRAAWPRIWTSLRRWPGLLLIPVVFGAALFAQGPLNGMPVICVFRLSTGLPCAGCGMTRAFLALAHGHWHQALDFNLISPFAFAWFAIWWLVAVGSLLRGREVPAHPPWLPRLGLLVVGSYWIGRLAWFAWQPHLWQRMVADSPVMQVLHQLLARVLS